jgi:drug/metabolite transporter (DMT)-like permease
LLPSFVFRPPSPATMKRFLPFLILAGGILVASTAAILIRLAQQEGMPSMTIATGRLLVASLILTPLAWARAGDDLRQLSRRDLLLGLVAGFFLAIHFAAWISSLGYTSVASSTALVATNPLWVAIASFFLFRERLGVLALAGIGLTFAGTILILVSDSRVETAVAVQHSAPTLGNLLALLGAVAASGYFLIGRDVRARLSLLAYIWLVYSSAAVMLLLATLLLSQPLGGYSLLAYLFVIGLAVGPQLLGHTAFNWSLRYLSATFVAVAVLGEPVGSAILAFILLQESVAGLQLAGLVLLLFGIYLAAVSERKRKKVAPETAVAAPEI